MRRGSVAFIIFVGMCIVLVGRMYQSCGKNYSIDKLSPKGNYRVKLEVTNPHWFGRDDEHCKIQYFKDQQVIGGDETTCRQDEYEDPLHEGWQVVEWLADNAVRVGRHRSDQPFGDELVISNKTTESIKDLDIGYGRFQTLMVFDLTPGQTLTLSASPEFKPDGTSNYQLGYGGVTQSGISFRDNLEEKKRTSPADGPLRWQITINPESIGK